MQLADQASRWSSSRLFAVLLLPIVAASCIKPGLLEDRPERGEPGARALSAEERGAVVRRLKDEPILLREEDIDALRVPVQETPYVDWSRPWSFRGVEVHLEFRLIRFRTAARETGWPSSFTILRAPIIEPGGLVWEQGPDPALTAAGRLRYRWDLYVPDVRETRHCLFYERQLDRHERRHLLYAEGLIRKLQKDGEDLVSRLLHRPAAARPAGGRGEPSAEESRRLFLQSVANRFVEDLPHLRDRYGSAAAEEARIARETVSVADSDMRDLEENCLARDGTKK